MAAYVNKHHWNSSIQVSVDNRIWESNFIQLQVFGVSHEERLRELHTTRKFYALGKLLLTFQQTQAPVFS